MGGSNEEDFDVSLQALFQRARNKNKERTAKPLKDEPIAKKYEDDAHIANAAGFVSSSDLDSSEAALFKIAREVDEKRPARCDKEDNVEKLMKLLNSYSNWEVRSILISIFKDGKGEALKERLIGKDQDTAKTDESSMSTEEDGDPSLPNHESSSKKDSNSSSGRSQRTQKEEECRGSGQSSSTPPHRRSRSGEGLQNVGDGNIGTREVRPESQRMSSSKGKKSRPRSLSSERMLGIGVDHAGGIRRSSAASSRQASIIAKRKELEKIKHTPAGTGVSHKRGARQKRTSLSPSRVRNQPRSETNQGNEPTRSPPQKTDAKYLMIKGVAKPKYGSADNLLGLGTSSHQTRRTRVSTSINNAIFNQQHLGLLGASLHGTSSEMAASSNVLRRGATNSLGVSLHGTNSDKAAPSRVVRRSGSSSTRDHPSGPIPPLGRKLNRTHSFDGTKMLSQHQQASNDEEEACAGEVGFLQFQPGENEKSQVATSFRHSVEVEALVDELRASAHDSINVMIEKSAKKSGDDPVATKKGKTALSFLRRKKKDQKEPISNGGAQNDCVVETSDDSDEESFN